MIDIQRINKLAQRVNERRAAEEKYAETLEMIDSVYEMVPLHLRESDTRFAIGNGYCASMYIRTDYRMGIKSQVVDIEQGGKTKCRFRFGTNRPKDISYMDLSREVSDILPCTISDARRKVESILVNPEAFISQLVARIEKEYK